MSLDIAYEYAEYILKTTFEKISCCARLRENILVRLRSSSMLLRMETLLNALKTF